MSGPYRQADLKEPAPEPCTWSDLPIFGGPDDRHWCLMLEHIYADVCSCGGHRRCIFCDHRIVVEWCDGRS